MSFLNIVKSKIKQNYRLYVFLRNIYGFQKGMVSLIRSKRGAKEHVMSTLSLMIKTNKIFGKPVIVTIEPTNVCNAKCPICETGAGELKRKKGFLSFDNFKIIIDKIYPYTNTLMYYFMGEPFLNKEWVKQIKYAKSKGIPFITACTNGDVEGLPEDIIESGIDFVAFQIGGMTQETHQIYRVNTNLNNIKNNVVKTIYLKRNLKSKVHIEVGFILMKHNEHELSAFIKWCKEIGVDSYNIIDPCVRTFEQGQKYLPSSYSHWIYDPEKFKQGTLCRKTAPQNDCPWIYYSIVVLWNGDVVPCCHDPEGEFAMGNLVTQEFEEIWNGNKFQEFRRNIHTNQRDIKICKLCSGYGVPWLR